MKMPSVMPGGHQFSQVPKATIPRSQFNRSFGYKTTMDAGYLIPFYVDEALPGDTFAMGMQGFARLATPLKPIMDNMVMSTFFFFVPNRLVWDNWVKFNGEQTDPGDSTDFVVPVFPTTAGSGHAIGSLADYFGIPTGNRANSFSVSALPFRAYHLIWNEWFRDQNLQDSVIVPKDDGPDGASYYAGPLRRGKRHDYFTSALPWPQKGDAVQLPLGTEAPVVASGAGMPSFTGNWNTVAGGLARTVGYPAENTTVSSGQYYDSGNLHLIATANQRLVWADPALTVDLSNATGATINDLRQSFQVQKLLERDARGGTRYTEIVRAHFGVTSPDARLQRPEYLGGGSSPVLISPVAQTSVAAGTPQGNLAGVGTVSFGGHGFTKSFTEHGVLIGLVHVGADLTYQYGLERSWRRQTRYDYYWPALSHIGEQAILNAEIYLQATAVDNQVFGYQERYAEYRYKPSLVTGLFRSDAAGSLDVWHLAQEFGSLPTLSPAFIVDDPPVDRVIAVPSEPHFLLDVYCNLKCARPMPVYGVPGLIDHF